MMAMTAQEALNLLRRYPAEIRIQILNHSKANDVVRLFTNSGTEEDKNMILVAQNLRFMKICFVNEIIEKLPKEDWLTVFMNAIKFLKKNCDRYGNCYKFGNGAGAENINHFLNWYVQCPFGRPRTRAVEVNVTLDAPILDRPALRHIQNNSMSYAATRRNGHQELLEVCTTSCQSAKALTKCSQKFKANFKMSGDLENSAFFYDSQTETIYFTSFQEETFVYKKKLTSNQPETAVLHTSLTGKFYIAVDSHHFHLVCHDGVDLSMVYADLTTGQMLVKAISYQPGMLKNIHAFGTHLVLEGNESVLIIKTCLKQKKMHRIEVGMQPSLLLNPHTFVYQTMRCSKTSMKILSKSPQGIKILTIPIEALRINRHSNQILGVLTPNAQRMYLIEDGTEPALLYSTRLEKEPTEYYD